MATINCSELGHVNAKNIQCKPIVEDCTDCNNVVEVNGIKVCKIYPDPEMRWMVGSCPLATHVEHKWSETGKKINPLKASKRAAKGH